MKSKNDKQSGNALWFILIAIFLLGGLTVMLSRTGSQTEETGSTERDTIDATRILRQGAYFRTGIDNLLLSGCSIKEISFATEEIFPGTNYAVYGEFFLSNPYAPTNKRCHVFYPQGGGLSLLDNLPPPNPNAFFGARYVFSGGMRILGAGDAAKFELSAYTAITSKSLCQKINKMAGISYTNDEPSIVGTGHHPPAYRGLFRDETADYQTEHYGGVEATGKKAVCVSQPAISQYRVYYILYVR